MAYLKPPWFTVKIFNRIAMPTGISNSETGAVTCVARETPAPERQPILTAYQKKAGRAVDGYFRKLPDPADHPVFALTAPTT